MIKKYNVTVYEKLTGKIRSSGTTCAPETLETNELSVLIGVAANIFAEYIEDGKIKSMSIKPSEHHVFDYTTKTWIDPRTPETEWSLVRIKRDRLLTASDWTDTLSAKTRLGDELYQAWQDYRQILRDITTQPDPFNIAWPQQPI